MRWGQGPIRRGTTDQLDGWKGASATPKGTSHRFGLKRERAGSSWGAAVTGPSPICATDTKTRLKSSGGNAGSAPSSHHHAEGNFLLSRNRRWFSSASAAGLYVSNASGDGRDWAAAGRYSWPDGAGLKPPPGVMNADVARKLTTL